MKDTSGQNGNPDPTNHYGNYNLVMRSEKYKNSALVTLQFRAQLDLFYQEKLIPGNVPPTLRLTPNNHSFSLMTTGQQHQYKIEITDAHLTIKTLKISPKLVITHQELLATNNFMFPHTKVHTMKFNLVANSYNAYFNNILNGLLPDRFIVYFVRDEAISGSYTLNTFYLENLNIYFIQLTIGNNQIPKSGYIPDFSHGDYISTYRTALAHLGYDEGNKMIALTPEEWANGFTFFPFKITRGPIGWVRTPQLSGWLSVTVKFAQETPYSVTAVILTQEPATLQIDKQGNPIVS